MDRLQRELGDEFDFVLAAPDPRRVAMAALRQGITVPPYHTPTCILEQVRHVSQVCYVRDREGPIAFPRVPSSSRHDILEETPLNWNRWIRQTHRWLSVIFTVAVLVNILLNVLPLASDQLVMWVGLLTLIPLTFLLVTGLYLFVLPYVTGNDNVPSADS
jgi:hypothetical protein